MQKDDIAAGAGRKPNVSVLPEQLLYLSRGFSCIFWSIPLGLILFAVVPSIQFSPYFRLPSVLVGLITAYCGLVLLRRASPITARWTKLINRSLTATFFQLYLAPFMYWWLQKPDIPYYFYNTLVFYLITAWGLFLVNQLTGEAGRALHVESLELESYLFRWAALLFMLVPLVVILILAVYTAFRLESRIWIEMVHVGQLIPRWIFIPLLLPFTLTMAMAWKAKEHCFAALRRSAKLPPPAGETETPAVEEE
jgi:hypothetical protein